RKHSGDPRHDTSCGLSNAETMLYRAISVVLLALGLSGVGTVAQSPPDDRRPILQRSIRLTAEQEYVIKENVKDVRGLQVAQNVATEIGQKISPDVELHTFPSLVIEKVPQVKAFKFFVTKDEIVLVSPQNTVADVIKKP